MRRCKKAQTSLAFNPARNVTKGAMMPTIRTHALSYLVKNSCRKSMYPQKSSPLKLFLIKIFSSPSLLTGSISPSAIQESKRELISLNFLLLYSSPQDFFHRKRDAVCWAKAPLATLTCFPIRTQPSPCFITCRKHSLYSRRIKRHFRNSLSMSEGRLGQPESVAVSVRLRATALVANEKPRFR